MSRLLCLTAASICAAPATHAATYTDRSAFEAVVVGGYTEDFESFAPVTQSFYGPAVLPSGMTISSEQQDLDFVGDLYVAAPGQSGNPSTAFGSNWPTTNSLTFDLGGEFSAFGTDLFQNFGIPMPDVEFVLFELSAFLDGSVVESTAGLIGRGGGFLGLTSTSLFDIVVLRARTPDAYEVVDNITVGNPSVATIPVPAGLSLLTAALGALGLVRHRARL